ncbi:hypothetical protein SAMD00019534_048480 [Acytostelium subglobosum LB1]|uniref:hypothetical protein n=1 Tax=Acytostelium subglobosum LB1 TaxID=1410327 RepID=UPI0006450B5F|nr:hypothetical protein SAMD00019534_048480 [Acytostelium subglobosum LB1]GAM21673.1 hypothetical protein SAMD00019534_048480 [Acytostelium subglobosum LB1]|eukprot:XP_012755792.1 hypothetical protein SAMD00019534_048480 [Acytostelium subglobosum LB1]
MTTDSAAAATSTSPSTTSTTTASAATTQNGHTSSPSSTSSSPPIASTSPQLSNNNNEDGVSNTSIKAMELSGAIAHQYQKPLPPIAHKPTDISSQWISNKLKEREPEYTKKDNMVIFLGTWNVNGKKPSEPLDAWLEPGSGGADGLSTGGASSMRPDIYAIGFQELDLTAEALLLGDTTRAAPWEQAIQQTLAQQGDYVKLLSRQLVGILLCVYVKKEHLKNITHVQSDIAAVGIMGMMGNKGGVAIRFQFYNTSICIINSHLNAHMENVMRRNQDQKDISRTLKFISDSDGSFINIYDHDQLFWIGDLNYRVPLPDQEVKDSIIQKDFYNLFLHDQLYLQMKNGAAFEGFQEPPISFAPTYKYDPGTNDYDSSEKKRTPAWCDRILWKTSKTAENVGILAYKRHELLSSDHRPVSGSFIIKVRVVIPEARARIYQEIVKELDKKENDAMPDANINTNSIDFGTVRFMVPVTRQIVIENIGQVIARFKFIPKLDERILCRPWLKISPIAGMMIPKEKITIELTVFVDSNTSGPLNVLNESMDDILILHLENGKDYFISISGKFQHTFMGNSLDNLVRYPTPILTGAPIPIEQKKLSIPKEIWRMIDHIYSNGMREESLFLESAVNKEMEAIVEAIDRGTPLPFHSGIHSMAECLIRFFEYLVEPVVPYNMYQQALDASSSALACKTLISHLPSVNYNVFFYLMSFLAEVLTHQQENKLTADQLAIVFSTVLLRPSPTSPQSQQTTDAIIVKKKADFIKHFIISKGESLV